MHWVEFDFQCCKCQNSKCSAWDNRGLDGLAELKKKVGEQIKIRLKNNLNLN